MASSPKPFFAVILILLGLVLMFAPHLVGLSVLPDCPNGQAEVNVLQPSVAYTTISPSLGIHCYNDGSQVQLNITPQQGLSAGWVVSDDDCSSGWCKIGTPVTYNQNPITITVYAKHFYAVGAFLCAVSSSGCSGSSGGGSGDNSVTTTTSSFIPTSFPFQPYTFIAGLVFVFAGIFLFATSRRDRG